MRIAFIVDPLPSLKAYKDSSIAMMRAAQAAGHAVWTIQQEALYWSPLHGVCAEAMHLEMLGDDHEWYVEIDRYVVALRDFGAVLMRKDPPFDIEYVTSTWLLEGPEARGSARFQSAACPARSFGEVVDCRVRTFFRVDAGGSGFAGDSFVHRSRTRHDSEAARWHGGQPDLPCPAR